MQQETNRSISNPTDLSALLSPVDSNDLLPCCLETIDQLAENNPMMVCDHCNQLIKIFLEEPSFRNYVRFCVSKGREIDTGKYRQYLVTTFRSYD